MMNDRNVGQPAARDALKSYILNNLHSAIEKGEIEVYYQPIIHSMSLQTSSLEALARWNSAELGMISPAVFIPVLEEAQMSAELDLQIVRLVLQEFRDRQDAGLFRIPVSVNISQKDLETRDMVSEICGLTELYGVDRRYLIIEITESAFIENPSVLKETIDRFHNAGFRVWMDDFGSGYSSLNTLQKFDFDLIKLDMRFLEDFDFSGRGTVVLKHLIRMAEELSIDTLIEGVETQEQLIFLKGLGVLYMQGFYFSEPHPLRHFLAMEGMEEKTVGYYTYITRETRSLEALPDALRERMKAVPQAILEEKDGMIVSLKANREYVDYLLRNSLVDLKSDYDDSAKTWRVRIPDAIAKAVLLSREQKQWTAFDDGASKGYVYVIAADEDRKAVCFRIMFY